MNSNEVLFLILQVSPKLILLQYFLPKVSVMGCMNPTQPKKALQKTESVKIQCHICYLLINESDMLILNCVHMFHRACLASAFTVKIKQRNLDLRCPDCATQLDYKSISAVLPQEIFALYDKTQYINSLILDESIFFCPTADCPGIYEIIPSEYRYFQCLFCKKDFCLICHQAYHGKSDCIIIDQESTPGCTNCPNPKCNMPGTKRQGCNIVDCSVCKLTYCFDCRGTKCGHYKCINKKP